MRTLSQVPAAILAISCLGLYGQEPVTNEAVLKMIRAGLGEDVIVGMINNEPGKYYASPDAVIALKAAGASDKIITAIVNKSSGTPAAINSPIEPNPSAVASIALHDGTPVKLRLSRNLSSADSKTGETVDFEVLEDVNADGVLVIARGGRAIGTVTQAEKKRRMARGGKLDITIDYVRLVNGDKVALRAVKETSGGGHAGAMTGAIVATALIAWPAAPFFLFMHGKDTVIPKDTEVAAYVNGEIKLDARKLVAK